jgi:hypothetical protein
MPLRNAGEIQTFQARYGLSQTGVMDSATEACAHQRVCPPLPASSTSSTSSSDGAICHDGILSNDRGQGCADGLYERTYGSGARASSNSGGTTSSSPSYNTSSGGYGGSSNSMVNPSCESGGNPQVWDPSGTYWGKYQFDQQTWVAHGGSPGSYGNAGVAEQDRVAANVQYDAWPNC